MTFSLYRLIITLRSKLSLKVLGVSLTLFLFPFLISLYYYFLTGGWNQLEYSSDEQISILSNGGLNYAIAVIDLRSGHIRGGEVHNLTPARHGGSYVAYLPLAGMVEPTLSSAQKDFLQKWVDSLPDPRLLEMLWPTRDKVYLLHYRFGIPIVLTYDRGEIADTLLSLNHELGPGFTFTVF